MATRKKEERESIFGCFAYIIVALTILLLFIDICGGRKGAKVETWASVLVLIFVILVLIVISRTKFKSLEDYFK